jgi:hypothetical protein
MFVIPLFLLAASLSINRATISRTKSSERTRISDVASDRARWAEIRGWMLLVGAGLCIALVAMLSGSVHARRPRSTQIADEVHLDRLPAELPGLGQRGRYRDRG